MRQNHLQQITVTTTTDRQTPKRDFGEMVGHAVSSAAAAGAGLIAPVSAAHPVLSAAVTAVKSVAEGATGVRVPSGSSAGGGGGSGGGDPMALVDANRQLMYEGAQLNQAYLQLQRDMQRESQQYTTVSNVMKARHDSAKAAINNIR